MPMFSGGRDAPAPPEKRRDMQTHLVAFEYGTGSVWGYVNAASRTDIESMIPEVDVFDEPPEWMTEDEVEELRRNAVDAAGDDTLDRLLRRSL
jgi:hypothetical protein